MTASYKIDKRFFKPKQNFFIQQTKSTKTLKNTSLQIAFTASHFCNCNFDRNKLKNHFSNKNNLNSAKSYNN